MAHPYLSAVRLREDVARALDVEVDAVGIVVDVYDDGSYEVEFSNERDGTTVALMTLREDQIEHFERRSPATARQLAD